jgi:hypothetical protein
MSVLKRLTPKTAGFVSALMLLTLCVSNNAFAIIAPTTKAVEGENSPFPTDTPKAPPKAPPAPATNGQNAEDMTNPFSDNTATTIQQGATVMASINPAVGAKRPALPVFWLALVAVMSLAGLTVAARLVFPAEQNAVTAS